MIEADPAQNINIALQPPEPGLMLTEGLMGRPLGDAGHSVTNYIAQEQQSTSPLDENSPVVSMDIRLGKKYRSVEFDYDAYSREATRLGTPSSLPVHIKPGFLKGGSYNRVDKSIVVKDPRANNTLVHEMNHAADEKAGIKTIDARYILGRLGIRSNIPLGATASVAMNISNLPLSHTSSSYLASLVGVNAVGFWGYYHHPSETRARKAADESTEKIITFQKK